MRTTYVWCQSCRAVYPKNEDGCVKCGAPPRFRTSRFGERRQATALRGARAAANLNAQAEHAVKHT